jgi:hypothetical protein
MGDGLDRVRALLPGEPLEVVDVLGGSSRSAVRRVRAGSRTVIVKEFLGEDNGWARESAALSVMPPGAPTSRLIAASRPVVVLADAGRGGSVADALLGDDPAAATEAVLSWARAIATVHRLTTGSREAFRRALGTQVAESVLASELADAADVIGEHAPGLGVEIPAEALAELRGLDMDGPAALTPADACPDNNILTGDGLVLIDFEGAQWRHPAWDIAYLTVPWPSCWCAWRLPGDVAARAVDAYRAALALPYAQSPLFDDDVAAAAAGWAFVSASWFLPAALADDPPIPRLGGSMPKRRAMIQHRLRDVRHNTALPALAALAARLDDALTDRWGDHPLAYAPAFQAAR